MKKILINKQNNIYLGLDQYYTLNNGNGSDFNTLFANGNAISCGSFFRVTEKGLQLWENITSYVNVDVTDTNSLKITGIDMVDD
jgi:hypothetical protein